ncbi:MAG: hypothetical protein IJQ54_04730, partial [Kiritimatiellae bacterium]|nr:hypothetical protein [Kiritimatiellia bacterium]
SIGRSCGERFTVIGISEEDRLTSMPTSYWERFISNGGHTAGTCFPMHDGLSMPTAPAESDTHSAIVSKAVFIIMGLIHSRLKNLCAKGISQDVMPDEGSRTAGNT